MKDPTEFHKIADIFLESIADTIENAFSEAYVEYLQGVLNIEFEDGRNYVINKHEPSFQIWLSSPISGAHKFKYTEGNWISSKDEGLKEILNKELGL